MDGEEWGERGSGNLGGPPPFLCIRVAMWKLHESKFGFKFESDHPTAYVPLLTNSDRASETKIAMTMRPYVHFDSVVVTL